MCIRDRYPDIEVVDDQRDNDFVEKAVQITEAWMQAYPDLGGILCNNMSNPVGDVYKRQDEMGELGVELLMKKLNRTEDHTVKYKLGTKLIVNESVKGILE